MKELPEITHFEWTADRVTDFWVQLRKTHMGDAGFAKSAGPRLVTIIDEFIPKLGATILDFGCGEPYLPDSLSDLGYQVTGFEPALSDEHINRDREWPRLVRELPDGPFDIIIVSEVIEHILDQDMDIVLSLIKDRLTPGGRLIFTTPYQENIDSNTDLCPNCYTLFHRRQHVRSMTTEMLDDWFPSDEGWERQHVGRYDFSNARDRFTAMKRYHRYQKSFAKKFTAALEKEAKAGRTLTPAETADLITTELNRMVSGGSLSDAGVDYSEGRGNVMIYVTQSDSEM